MNSNRRIALFFGVIGIIIGVVLTLGGILYYNQFVNPICISIGVAIVLVNIFPLIISYKEMKYNKRYLYNFIVTIIFIILGIVFAINHTMVISFVFGFFLIVLPLIRIIVARDKLKRFLNELPLLLLGTLLFFNVTDLLFQIAIVAFGIGLVIISGLNIILPFFKSNEFAKEEVIDMPDEEA